ncbi:polysaccharide deacetylase family protein [Streptomyces nitrosporeus]|uniref:polysaccharide deacetylase family protein n=1 Tax=Streptomyces nitrosporeus TaxID=28894 RepID=UPI00332F8ECE
MQLVRQKGKSGSRRYGPVGVAVSALLAAAVASGCAGGAADGPDRGQPASPAAGREAQAGHAGPAPAAGARAEGLKRKQAARAVAAKKWGLDETPLAAPEPPAKKPRLTTREGFEVKGGEDLPPVFTTVPTEDRVVFLTMDDGSEKDPELLRMMTELDIPYSAFLSDYVVRDDYGYFEEMQKSGVVLGNHTLTHPYLPGLSADEQREEICGEQDRMEERFGKRPTLFRPPYGNYNGDTLRIAKSCGIEAVPLWAAEAFPGRMEWRERDQDLHPGDIILTHFRGEDEWGGSMADMIRTVMKTVTGKGYAVARLEDYV